MCAKEVLRSVLRSTDSIRKPSARVYGRSSTISIARAHSATFPIHSPLCSRKNHFFASQAPRRCELYHYLCRPLRRDATIIAHVSDSKIGKHVDMRFHVIPVRHSIHARSQDGEHESRRNLSMQTMEDIPDQPHDPDCDVHTSNVKTVNSHESQANLHPLNVQTFDSHKPQILADEMHISECEVVLRKDTPLLGADSLATEEVNTDDDTSEEGTDAEKEFYSLIEAEDSPDELLSMLMKLEEVFPSSDPRVCQTCLRLANLFNDTDRKPEKILDYARQAFHNFDASKFPLESARALFLVGMGNYKMGDLKEAVASLEKCAYQMEKLELPTSAKKQELAILQHSVQVILGQAKISLGLNCEGLLEFRKGLAAVEKTLPPGSPFLASCYQEMAAAFLQAKELTEALDLCRKALSVFMKCFGSSSREVADLRSLMLQIHYELKDYESVLHESQLASQSLEKLGERDKAVSLELESMQAYFLLGKFNEAVNKLNEIVKGTQEEDSFHIEALILLMRAFTGLDNATAATEYSQRALRALEKKELNFDSAKTLIRLSTAYQQLQNYDEALAISQRALDFFERCAGEEAAACAADAQAYRGSLFLSIGKPNEAIPHLERALVMKRSVYGSESAELLDVSNQLGVAYAHAGRVDEALAVFREAKAMLDTESCGHDRMWIHINNNLSLTCSMSGRTEEARESKKSIQFSCSVE